MTETDFSVELNQISCQSSGSWQFSRFVFSSQFGTEKKFSLKTFAGKEKLQTTVIYVTAT